MNNLLFQVITTSTASADRALESGVDDMNEAVRKHIGNDDRNTQKYGRHAQKSREYDEKQLRNRRCVLQFHNVSSFQKTAFICATNLCNLKTKFHYLENEIQ